MRLEDHKPMAQTMIKKFMEPGDTVEQGYDKWRENMRMIASRGGKNGKGNKFAHGKISARSAGLKGSKKRWGNE